MLPSNVVFTSDGASFTAIYCLSVLRNLSFFNWSISLKFDQLPVDKKEEATNLTRAMSKTMSDFGKFKLLSEMLKNWNFYFDFSTRLV